MEKIFELATSRTEQDDRMVRENTVLSAVGSGFLQTAAMVPTDMNLSDHDSTNSSAAPQNSSTAPQNSSAIPALLHTYPVANGCLTEQRYHFQNHCTGSSRIPSSNSPSDPKKSFSGLIIPVSLASGPGDAGSAGSTIKFFFTLFSALP